MLVETLGGHEAFDTGGLWAISTVFSSDGVSKQSSPASKLRSCRYPLKGIVERRRGKGRGNINCTLLGDRLESIEREI
jgi:hypothetical protein